MSEEPAVSWGQPLIPLTVFSSVTSSVTSGPVSPPQRPSSVLLRSTLSCSLSLLLLLWPLSPTVCGGAGLAEDFGNHFPQGVVLRGCWGSLILVGERVLR